MFYTMTDSAMMDTFDNVLLGNMRMSALAYRMCIFIFLQRFFIHVLNFAGSLQEVLHPLG